MVKEWVWLMVGGPWHGTFKLCHVRSEGDRIPRQIHVPDPINPVYVRESEFETGVSVVKVVIVGLIAIVVAIPVGVGLSLVIFRFMTGKWKP
jgi:hypothetical protein